MTISNTDQENKKRILRKHDHMWTFLPADKTLLFEEISYNSKAGNTKKEWINITNYSVRQLLDYLGY